MKYLFTTLFTVIFLTCQSQTKTVFGVETFIQQIKQYHPIAKQAAIQVDKATAALLTAKGAFDPTINVDASRKTFDGKNYYYYTNPELKVPLPVGDVKTGIENNGGSFLSSEESNGKTSYLGLEIPLAKGLLIDKRRATLQQAKIFRNQSEQEKLKMLNDLLFDAYNAYWQWAGAFQQYIIFSKYVQINTDRLRLLRITNANGDRSVMDTLEAFTQLQNFEIMQTDALQKFNNATIEISNYLWQKNDSAYILPTAYIPDEKQFANNLQNIDNEDAIVTAAITQNPNIRTYDFKLQSLEVDRKLKQQNLLPTLNAKANLLNKDYAVFKGISTNFLENNYKWGIDFKIPIFLREGRGDYKQAKLKITETTLELNQKKWQVENKVKSYFNDFVQLKRQLQIAQIAYTNYNKLYSNELLKFDNGESSLFLLNSRETKTLEMLQKTIELRVKFFKAKYAIEWAAGQLR